MYLLESWKLLGWKDAELWIVGRVERPVARLLKQYERLEGVHFLRHSGDPAPLFRESDVFVLPTLEEGSALVVFEALASGLPVITTPQAGSVVRDGQDGFLVPIRDAEALAARLDLLRSDHVLRKEMSVSARRRAQGFDWHRYEKALVDLLHQVSFRSEHQTAATGNA
jgi:glycosyltransferase involved in cell wall biosynthesis